jgi:anti-anti-sigma regulatory factor
MSRFFLGINTVEDVSFLKVSGTIDEDNTLAGSLKKIEGRTVVIDLSGVERINSCGVRDWVNWLNDLESAGKQVVLVRCSPCIVTQINLVHNFTGRGLVKSFFAPYYCGRCDKEQLKLLQVEAFAGHANPRAPACRADGCQQVHCELAFDDIEASYFAFLPRSGGQVKDEKLPKLIEGLSPSIKDRIKRLDTVEQISGEQSGAPGSAQYSPLTVTTPSLSMNLGRESIGGTLPPPPTDLDKARTGSTFKGLLVAALILVLAIVGYVVYYVGGQ